VGQLISEDLFLALAKDNEGKTPIKVLIKGQYITTINSSLEKRKSIYHLLINKGATPDIVAAIVTSDMESGMARTSVCENASKSWRRSSKTALTWPKNTRWM
jgi:hypothetical protein